MARCTCPNKECEIHGTPLDPQHGREPEKVKPCHPKCKTCAKLRTPKPLAQYLDEYIEHETGMDCHYGTWRELLEQALNAYQSTENVTIKIERNME